ncbi:unnamed protein product, partial [Phaeothamnion confervicola]
SGTRCVIVCTCSVFCVAKSGCCFCLCFRRAFWFRLRPGCFAASRSPIVPLHCLFFLSGQQSHCCCSRDRNGGPHVRLLVPDSHLSSWWTLCFVPLNSLCSLLFSSAAASAVTTTTP